MLEIVEYNQSKSKRFSSCSQALPEGGFVVSCRWAVSTQEYAMEENEKEYYKKSDFFTVKHKKNNDMMGIIKKTASAVSVGGRSLRKGGAVLAALLLSASVCTAQEGNSVNLQQLQGNWAFQSAEFTTYRQSDSSLVKTTTVTQVEDLRSAGYPFGMVFKFVECAGGTAKCALGSSFGLDNMTYRIEANMLNPITDQIDINSFPAREQDRVMNAFRPLSMPAYDCTLTADNGLQVAVHYASFSAPEHAFPLFGTLLMKLAPTGSSLQSSFGQADAFVFDGQNPSFVWGRQLSEDRIAIGLTDEGEYQLRNETEIWLINRPQQQPAEQVATVRADSETGDWVFIRTLPVPQEEEDIIVIFRRQTRDIFSANGEHQATVSPEGTVLSPQGQPYIRFNLSLNPPDERLGVFFFLHHYYHHRQ